MQFYVVPFFAPSSEYMKFRNLALGQRVSGVLFLLAVCVLVQYFIQDMFVVWVVNKVRRGGISLCNGFY